MFQQQFPAATFQKKKHWPVFQVTDLLSNSAYWQPRDTLHKYVSTSYLLRGFIFFGADLQT